VVVIGMGHGGVDGGGRTVGAISWQGWGFAPVLAAAQPPGRQATQVVALVLLWDAGTVLRT
jgi:hypothetical protein